MRAEGPRLVLDPELRDALLGKLGDEGITPRAAAAWLVHSLATDMRGRIQISQPEQNILLFGATLRKPHKSCRAPAKEFF